MREVEKLCDRIAIIHRGKILAEGTLEALRDEHQEHDFEELFFQLISRYDERIEMEKTRLQLEQKISQGT
jgi:sodium transport system ATP-binding protein